MSEVKVESFFKFKDTNNGIKQVKEWLRGNDEFKLTKAGEIICKQIYENWIKYKLKIYKALQEQEEVILNSLNDMRKEVKWINNVSSGKAPQVDPLNSKLFQYCLHSIKKNKHYRLQEVKKRGASFVQIGKDQMNENLTDVIKSVRTYRKWIEKTVSMKQLLSSETPFYFHPKHHHEEIVLSSPLQITSTNKSQSMDFGAVVYPFFSKYNNHIQFRIQSNFQYSKFIGIGLCHPKIIKKKNFNGSGSKSGCYLLRQEDTDDALTVLSHLDPKIDPDFKYYQSLKWGFEQDDYIDLEVDFESQLATFTCRGNSHSIHIKVGEPIAAYVTLHRDWDSVSIVN